MERIDTGRTQKMADGWDTGSGAHGTIHRDGRETGVSGVPVTVKQTTGWRPTCTCESGDPIGCTVLDPFAGSGTVAAVAASHWRKSIGIELSKEYTKLFIDRVGEVVDATPLFDKPAAAEKQEVLSV